ncbi:MAG TPA: MarR family transcriptional regulator [Bacteroidota bacterium]|nr:MarR family transcriptional regulator [Bacteroidota bacterium]
MKTTEQYGPKADLALTMWVKLARAFSTFNKLTAEHIWTFGLTQPQFGALETLGHLGPMTIGELCKKQLVSGGNMTVVIDNLTEQGLATRVTSKEDRRAYIVKLTPKGKKLFQKIFANHAEVVAKAASVLSDEEQAELGKLLKKLGTTCRGHSQGV